MNAPSAHPAGSLASDEKLLDELRGGNQRAFAHLVEEYKGMVVNLAFRMTGQAEASEDLAQEVFLRVWKGLSNFRGECKLSTWIYRITLNLCIAEGKTARGRSQFLPVDDPAVASLPAMRTGSENPYSEEVTLKHKMMLLIPKMPEAYRSAVTLYYLKDLSYVEIAEIMEVPIGTVKSHLFRGKAWLRERLLGKNAEGENIA